MHAGHLSRLCVYHSIFRIAFPVILLSDAMASTCRTAQPELQQQARQAALLGLHRARCAQLHMDCVVATHLHNVMPPFTLCCAESVDTTTYEYSAVFYVPPPILFRALTNADDIQVRATPARAVNGAPTTATACTRPHTRWHARPLLALLLLHSGTRMSLLPALAKLAHHGASLTATSQAHTQLATLTLGTLPHGA